MSIIKRIKGCAGCARRRAKIKAAYEATKQGAKTARQLYLQNVGKIETEPPAGHGHSTRVVRVQ